MKLVYISSGIGLHIESLVDYFYSLLEKDFVFVSTSPQRKNDSIHRYAEMGRDYSTKPYNLNVWESKSNRVKANDLINRADVVIAGGAPFDYFIERIKEGKCTYLCNERWFKNPFYKISPKSWKFLLGTLKRNQSDNFYFLALGAYCANDAHFLRIFKDRIYHFAYLVPIEQYDVIRLLETKRNDVVKIMWCARFIDWKHPELVVGLAKLLVNNNYTNFEITMIGGNTPMQDQIKKKIAENGLDKYIKIIEGVPNQEVRRLMKESNVFIITSDRKEGWGAVLNEAMGSGCAIVASNQIGSVPVLLKHGENGLIFRSKSVESLFYNVKVLLDDVSLRERLAVNAYSTVTGEWSVENVAKRFLLLSQSILDGQPVSFSNGPCAKAYPCCENKLL